MPTPSRLIAVLALSIPLSLFAQGARSTPAAAVQRVADDQAEQRRALAAQLVGDHESLGREFPAPVRAALIERLGRETLDQLRAREQTGNISTNALGDTQTDLVYTPFQQPCRIIDTRVAGGALTGGAPGPARFFKVAGSTGFAAQGGTAAGCGVPIGATAVFINFVAVNPAGIGNLRGAAVPNPIPATGSIVNYQALTPALNIANGLLFPICDPTTTICDNDLSLAANGAATDVVADVVGYATKFDKTQVSPFIVENSTSGGPSISTCTMIQSISVNAPVAGTVEVRAKSVIIIDHSPGTSAQVDLYLTAGSAACTGEWGLSHDFYYLPPGLPSGGYSATVSVFQTFAVPAGTNVFYLSAANASTDPMTNNTTGISATFIPN